MATYHIDPAHSSVGFSVRHLMITRVNGVFEKFSGSMIYDPASPEKTTAEATIDAASINTHVPDRDKHLRSPEFFDVAKFPQLTFKSKRVVRAGGRLRMVGDLTIHGVAKEVTLDVESPSSELKDPHGNLKIGLSGTTQIDRRDFGLTWNAVIESGGVLVGHEVTITLDLQFVRKS